MTPTTRTRPRDALPAGCVLRRLRLTHLGEPFDWFRVEMNGALLGSGFDAAEAVELAWEEWMRRRVG